MTGVFPLRTWTQCLMTPKRSTVIERPRARKRVLDEVARVFANFV